MGHIAGECPQGTTTSNERGDTSEPMVGDMGRSHMVFAVVDNCQFEDQAIVIEDTCMIRGIKVSILFDFRATNSFVSPFVVEHYMLVITLGRMIIGKLNFHMGLRW